MGSLEDFFFFFFLVDKLEDLKKKNWFEDKLNQMHSSNKENIKKDSLIRENIKHSSNYQIKVKKRLKNKRKNKIR